MLQSVENPAQWGLQGAQVHAITRLVNQLANTLPTSIGSLSGLTYDGVNRLTGFVADGIVYTFTYPDAFTINLTILDAGRTYTKQITVNAAGQLTGVT